MKRLVVLLLALGIVASADHRTWADKDAKKEDKKDVKKDDKKEAKKEKKDDEKPKVVVALTEEQKKELGKLSGTFKVTKFERDGKPSSADELKKMKVVQKVAEWTFFLGEDATKGRDVVMPDKTPKAIDSTYTDGRDKGKTVKGIYKIDGKTITYCWAASEKDRPTEFATKADDGSTLMVLERMEEKKPDDKPKGKPKDKDKK
jgi:uncharacterized protein (TIGR03067 family)